MRAKVEKGTKFQGWLDRLAKPEAALKKIGALMVAESQLAFKRQRFGALPWRDRKVPNKFGIIADLSQSGTKTPPKRRFEKAPVLMDKGRLRQSLSFRLVGQDAVEVGSNMPYGGVHNYGGPIESLPITENVQQKLKKFLTTKAGMKWQSKLIFLTLPGMKGQKLRGRVPARQFVGITKQTSEDIERWIGVKVFEAR